MLPALVQLVLEVVDRCSLNDILWEIVPIFYHALREGAGSRSVCCFSPQNSQMVTESRRPGGSRWNEREQIVNLHSDKPVEYFEALNHITPE